MAARSLNKVQLIGNLTRDPELRYTPQGTAVCSFGLATNRSWVTETGEKREETEFHRVVAWNKLAELCSQLLFKGRKVFVEGRLQSRQWTAQDGTPRQTTEVIISEMIVLDSKRGPGEETEGVVPEEPAGVKETPPAEVPAAGEPAISSKAKTAATPADKTQANSQPASSKSKAKKPEVKRENEEVKADDIPF
jgi:single-strand DNA-binding protein